MYEFRSKCLINRTILLSYAQELKQKRINDTSVMCSFDFGKEFHRLENDAKDQIFADFCDFVGKLEGLLDYKGES